MELIIRALELTNLGYLSGGAFKEDITFGFVHRRFQEYFCAQYLREHPTLIRFENLPKDNRWREILVLLCEILPDEELQKVFAISQQSIEAALVTEHDLIARRRAIETLRFLREAFRIRLSNLPDE